jgi:hypothetical protein
VTGWTTTGTLVGSSSVAWEVSAGVITSTAFGTLLGGNVQIGAVPPGAHTPNWNSCAVGLEAARLVAAEAVLAGQNHTEAPSDSGSHRKATEC